MSTVSISGGRKAWPPGLQEELILLHGALDATSYPFPDGRPYRTEIWSPQRPGAPGTCTGRRSEQSQCVFTELPSTQLKHLLDYMLISFDSVRAEEISLLRGLRLLPPPALPLEHLLSGPVTQGVQYSFPHTRGEDHKRKGRGDRPEAGSREEDGLQQGWQSPKFPPRRMKSWRDKLGIVVQVCNPSY